MTQKSSCCPESDSGSSFTAKRKNVCCPSSEDKAQETAAPCCPPIETRERTGYRIWPFVAGWLETPAGSVPRIATRLTTGDMLGRWQMRWGIGRMRYRIAPGLYAAGSPGPEAPVLVTANYKMSFDALRRELGGLDCWILVLETRGINVWCAAGKGTFGTDELISRVRSSGLEEVVSHRRLIVPQLGAVGVAAHEVRKGCGFQVLYGPVRASDLPAYLAAGNQATPAMRRVQFSAVERLVLTPVELTGMLKTTLWAIPVLFLLGGIGPEIFSFSAAITRGGAACLVYFMGLLCGAVLTPVALPWIPGRAFALKGAIAGVLAGIAGLLLLPAMSVSHGAAFFLLLLAVSSYCAMNFTGSTTYTSPSGVGKEMRRALPLQALALLGAGVVWIWSAF